ncbi:hypothetical protein DNH61_20825 [Paenibacillus sambharensis]|uniref:Uncharacterized protein n=1 Tax=Paenibacillus sambharensis TaxID=1803190 RepID=A0A2W1LR94_9BACL|nr:hypothetical protein [Paenibacillus sambharensis]PZD93937.1 hypothetical protein DNH61_20825 [Paenibacillus sambharensis]
MIERLIYFLLDNIFIVVVIGGFLLSLLGKKAKAPSRMPDFGGQGRPMQQQSSEQDQQRDPDNRSVGRPAEVRREFRPEGAEPIPTREGSRSPFGSTGGSLSAEGSTPGWYGEGTPAPARPVRPAPVRTVRTSPARPDDQSEVLRTDADELRRAVIWAEVLGPPRAKRPYGRK